MLSVRAVSQEERQQLYDLLEHRDEPVRKRAKAVLLSAEGYSANEMVPRVNLTAKSIRRWLSRFNKEGIPGLTHPHKSPGPPPTFSGQQRQRLRQLALTPPQELGQPFSSWSLAKLQEHLVKEGIGISRAWLWQILKEQGVSLQRAKRLLTSPDPEYALKKNASRSWCANRPHRPTWSSSTRSGRRR